MYEQADFFERATLLNKDLPGFGILLHKRDHLSKVGIKLLRVLRYYCFDILATGCKISPVQYQIYIWQGDKFTITQSRMAGEKILVRRYFTPRTFFQPTKKLKCVRN